MALSPSDELTSQFYEWELRGRGWHYAPYAVDLEPPFHPFFGHFIQTPYTDDGRKPTLLSRFADLFRHEVPEPDIQQYQPPEVELYPFEESAALEGYAISFQKNAKPSIELMEQCLVMLSGIHEPISFEIIADSTRIVIQIIFRQPYGLFIYSQLKAFFPDAAIVPITEDLDNIIAPDLCIYTVDYGLSEEYMRPINTTHAHTDSLMGFWGICEQLRYEERVVLQVLFNGVVNHWTDSIERSVSDGHKGSFFLDAPEMPNLAREKCSKPLFATAIRVFTQDETIEDAAALLEKVSFAIQRASTSPFNALTPLIFTDYTIDCILWRC
jgi:hypothetical protein